MSFDYSDDLMMQTTILSGHTGNGGSQRSWSGGGNSTSSANITSQLEMDAQDEADLDAELFHGYSTSLLTLASACCLFFMFVGIPGNLITIIALFRCKKVRNATAVFIINLSVSDLMSCCFNLPLAASTFWRRAWRHGLLLCRLFPLLRYGLLAVSLFTVLAITINRYVMIGHPTLYPKLYRKQYLGLMVGSTWVCGFGALVATWMGKWGRFGLDPRIGSCSILPDGAGRSPKEFLFLVAFVIPCISIVVCYARIFYIVRKTALKSRLRNAPATGSASVSAGPCKSSYYSRYKFTKKYNPSSTEDSALGSSSTGPSSSTFLENGTSVETAGEGVTLKMVSLGAPSPHLLSPPGASPLRSQVEVSSSSGMEPDEEQSSRSCSPVSGCSSSRPASPQRRKKRRRKERLNSTLSQVASVFRRGGQVRCSPRRPSSAPPLPGKMTPKDKKLLKMILVIFASFVTCYLPITISKTYRDKMDVHALNIAGYILIYLTTCINPVIYVVMSSEYRQAYKNLLMCRTPDSQLNTGSKP